MNLEDIARFSGVSRSTVSRVINNDPHVSDKTRENVLKIIAEHNYAPNIAARALVTKRTHVIGIYISNVIGDLFSDPYFSTLLQAIVTRANEQDFDVMLWLKGQETSIEHFHQRILDNRMTDGLVLSSTSRYDTLPQALLQRNRTFVLNGRPWCDEEHMNYVDATNQHGAQQAVEHLARMGHKRIATITGRLDLISGYDRLIGYRQAIEHLELPFEDSLVIEGDFTEISGYIGMRKLISEKPDAVFIASDHMAIGALRAIRESGLQVPDDIALVGFDDMSFATMTSPQLTTVRQPVQRQGILATEGLIGLLEGSITPPYQVSLPTQLVIRESCGFPA
ncbi:MAG: LacI family DNA-binding transcriptional regulator [Anaerolineae bacterium]|nr:LacI family DNA-binding transcriptional regulator [Anaerolineae bacterium]